MGRTGTLPTPFRTRRRISREELVTRLRAAEKVLGIKTRDGFAVLPDTTDDDIVLQIRRLRAKASHPAGGAEPKEVDVPHWHTEAERRERATDRLARRVYKLETQLEAPHLQLTDYDSLMGRLEMLAERKRRGSVTPQDIARAMAISADIA